VSHPVLLEYHFLSVPYPARHVKFYLGLGFGKKVALHEGALSSTHFEEAGTLPVPLLHFSPALDVGGYVNRDDLGLAVRENTRLGQEGHSSVAFAPYRSQVLIRKSTNFVPT